LGSWGNAFLIVICLPGGPNHYGFSDSMGPPELAEHFTYNYFSALVDQAGGSFFGFPTEVDEGESQKTYTWLFDAASWYAESRLLNPAGRLKQSYTPIAPSGGKHGPERCNSLQLDATQVSDDDAQFAEHMLAMVELEERFGADSFVRFFSDLGFTLDWRVSFQNVYGDTPEKVFGCGATQ